MRQELCKKVILLMCEHSRTERHANDEKSAICHSANSGSPAYRRCGLYDMHGHVSHREGGEGMHPLGRGDKSRGGSNCACAKMHHEVWRRGVRRETLLRRIPYHICGRGKEVCARCSYRRLQHSEIRLQQRMLGRRIRDKKWFLSHTRLIYLKILISLRDILETTYKALISKS